MVELKWPTYRGEELRTVKELREIFPDGIANEYNWVFCSQQCFHGDSTTLDEVEEIILGGKKAKARPIDGKWSITVLVVCPRTTCLKYGYIEIGIDDVEFMRSLVRTTLELLPITQKGNV